MPVKKKKAVGKVKTAKRKAPVKRKTATRKTVRKAVKRTVKQTQTIIQRGQKILAEINRLEAVRKTQKEKAGKDFYALAINKEHKKLTQLQKNLK
jgi:DNA-binding ferritin-like protein